MEDHFDADESYPEVSRVEPQFEQTGDIREFPQTDTARRVLDIVNALGEVRGYEVNAHFLDDTSTREIDDAIQSLIRNGKIRYVGEDIYARLKNPAPGCGTTIDHLYL